MYNAIYMLAPKFIDEIEKNHPESKIITQKLQLLISDPLCFDQENVDNGNVFATGAEKTLLISNLKKINEE